MKQEPVKKWKQPGYAALAAALTVSAGMMTACGNHSLHIDGTAPNTDVDSGYTEPVIGGEVAVEPEPTDTTGTQTDTTDTQTETTADEMQQTMKILSQEEMQAWWDENEPEPHLMGKVAPMRSVYQMNTQTTAPEPAETESDARNITQAETETKETIS